MAGEISSVISIAAAGLLPEPPGDIGVAIDVNGNLSVAIGRYNAIDVVSQFKSVVANSSGNITDNLLSMSANDFPSINDVLPGNLVAGNLYPAPLWGTFDLYNPGDRVEDITGAVYENILQSTEIAPGNVTYWTELLSPQAYLTDIVDSVATYILPVSDASRFCQIFTASQGYVDQTNVVINSVNNSNILESSFAPASGGMNYITTAGLNLVSTDFQTLGTDLINLGSLIDLANLNSWGFPGELLAQIGRVSGGEVPEVAQALLDAGLARSDIISLSGGTNNLSASAQKTVYQVMTRVTGSALNQVLAVLGVTTPNIRNMADLLDLRKILPNSFGSLLCPTAAGSAAIFLGSTPDAGANPNLIPVVQDSFLEQYTGPNTVTSYNVLSKITPGDQALSNKAFSRALQQVKNIASANLPAFAQAVRSTESNAGLDLIINLTAPVPDTVKTFLQENLAEGTGANGQLLLSDIIGVTAGIGFNDNFDDLSSTLETMTDQGIFDSLTGVTGAYSTMANTLAGDYTSFVAGAWDTVIPAGRPGAGTYSGYATSDLSIEAAMITGVIPGTGNIIANIAVTYDNLSAQANDYQQEIIDNLQRQVNNLILSEIDINEIVSNNRSAALSFASNLHEFGVDLSPGGANDILQAVANVSTLSGQALVASLREGRNIFALQAAGIEMDTQLPT
jgi:hypothetical protein